MEMKPYESYLPEKQPDTRESIMSRLTKTQIEQIKALEALENISDSEIDTSDIPEITNWDDAVVGKFYRPIKKPVTIRLDIDVIEWFKSQNGKYQSNINKALREYMKEHMQTAE